MAKNNFFFSIIWLVVLVLLAWPLAIAVSWIWILLQVRISSGPPMNANG